ncbi:putative nucleotidyltransferase, ribonuclease H [Tanacetum coccineum]
MGECFHGLYHMLSKVKRGGSIIVVVDRFSKYETGGSIIVVVDRFSKYGTFIAVPPDVTADDTAKLFFKNMIMGTDLNFSTNFHPQTNGQMKRVNALLELYLWHYVSVNQHNWAKLLDVAQFSYNMQRNEATGKSPFELVTGRQPLTPNALAASYERSSPAAYKTMKEWHEQADLARASLDKAAKKMKKWTDEKRRHVEFEVGDQVMLPPKLKIHPVFHVSFLKPYHGDEEDPRRGVSKQAPIAVVTSYDREVEDILSDHTIRRRGVPSYKEHLIKWHDLPDSEEKVLEALGSPWKLPEDLEAFCRRM